jgi:hypothetical protein
MTGMSTAAAIRPAGSRIVAICGLAAAVAAAAVIAAAPSVYGAEAASGYLGAIHRHALLTSTVPSNGDLNPYAVVIAPVSLGKIRQNDVLVTNFNNVSNLQGTGTTIIDYSPATKQATLFASLPQHLPQCPGGVGLGTAMAVLKSGWVIVGSTPSTDGTTRTKGAGCLLVLDASGQLATAWSGPNINDPWGNMAVIDNGATATLFVSMAGFDVPGLGVTDPKTGDPVTVNKATVVRIELSIPAGAPPAITGETVIAHGFGQRADRDAFLIGPTGLALAPDGTLYVSDALGNRIAAIDNATTRTTSAGTGRTVTQDRLIERPLAMCFDPDGNLLVTNAKNGKVVEVDPKTGSQLLAQWIDADQAQSPPGNGDLFGIAVKLDGSGFYYVEDDVNTLMEGSR